MADWLQRRPVIQTNMLLAHGLIDTYFVTNLLIKVIWIRRLCYEDVGVEETTGTRWRYPLRVVDVTALGTGLLEDPD